MLQSLVSTESESKYVGWEGALFLSTCTQEAEIGRLLEDMCS